ncbi:MAG: glycoside hydrolase family 28 protein [Lachnospiraceae bacterium]|nr:glycoside hydrolase family 28 protein [Lachnospiraceae bacterium]
MDIRMIMKTARSVSVELYDGGIYYTKKKYDIFLNGEKWQNTDTVVTTLYGLKPDSRYKITVAGEDGREEGSLNITTEYEFVTLNVRDFGAKGDGVSDDTSFIQAAISSCPRDSRVLIPRGTYKVTSLFLKSDINIELAKGAVLKADTERFHFAILPGLIESYDEMDEYNLGSWEGNPLDMFAGIISGIEVSNVKIYGQGTVDGSADFDNWWKNEKDMVGAFRPRMLFLNHCDNIKVQGIFFHNSPAWTIHPYFSSNLVFCSLKVENPAQSPNTNGIVPDSSEYVEICGTRFSSGDDCVAVKSGKIYMGRKYKTPCRELHIYQCLMENGHGAVTIGSEMAGGVIDLLVEKCRFNNTDRGLRIKTRRGRGKDAVVDQITFRDIEMDQVLAPFTANAFYYCDPDGKTEFVQSRESRPVNEGTPELKTFCFENITANNCHVSATYFEGLPERKIEQVTMRNITVNFAEDAKCDLPIMSEGVEPCSKKGVFMKNVAHLIFDNVKMFGHEGEVMETPDVDRVDLI